MTARTTALLSILSFALAGCPTPILRRTARLPPLRSWAYSLPKSEDELLRASELDPRFVSYWVEDADSGALIASREAGAPRIPASVTKLLTAAAALDVLGPEYRWETTLWRTGEVRDGVLEGDLYLQGAGDPQLRVADLARLADALAASGLRCVKGRFLFDDSAFPSVSQIDREFDADAAYDPGIGPLSLDSNAFEVKWYPAAGGRATEIYAVPLTGGLLFSLAPAPLPGGRRFAYAAEDERTERWLLTPDASREGVAWLPVKRPGPWTARVFQALARQSGVTLPPPECAVLPAKAEGVATHQSPPLRSVLETMLVNSDNAMAELVLMATARKLSPEVSTLEGAATEVSRYWAAQLPGVDWSLVHLVNGSGLTSANRLTSQALVAVLAHATRERRSADPFRTLLPLSGWRGTLSSRLDTPDTALDVWAKTGTLDYASAIAGQLTSATGRRVFFAVLISDPDARAERASKLDAKADAWTKNARRLADALIQSWAGRL